MPRPLWDAPILFDGYCGALSPEVNWPKREMTTNFWVNVWCFIYHSSINGHGVVLKHRDTSYIYLSNRNCKAGRSAVWMNRRVWMLPTDSFWSRTASNLLLNISTRAACEFLGLTLLLRIRTLWRYGDGLFCEVPPWASDALHITLHPLPENVLQSVDRFEISCLGAPFSWL
jgi:hypothetical protein